MNAHSLVHKASSVWRANSELLQELPATEEFRGLRSLLVRAQKHLETKSLVFANLILNPKEP